MPESRFSAGDRVRIRKHSGCPFSESHDHCDGCEGVIERVDDSDNTAHVRVDTLGHATWFKQDGLELIRKAPPPAQVCSCNGPEKIVMILFQPVRVCTTCKKEKP